MIETRAVPRRLPFTERVTRAASLEGLSAGALMFVWTLLGFVSAPIIWLWLILLAVGLLILFFALDTGSAAIQVLVALLFLGTTAGIGAAVFANTSASIGLVAAAASTLLLMELFRLHEARRRNALVSPALLAANLPWTAGVVIASFVLVIVLTPSSRTELPWVFVPLASGLLVAAVVGLAFWSMSDKSRRSGGRFDPALRTPPAPRQVDPLVAQARKAVRKPGDGAMPPPPKGEPTGKRPSR